MTVTRFDTNLRLDSWEVTPEGYLKAWGSVARIGSQEYLNADGSTRIEYRPLEEVSKPESLATFGGAPITLLHPPSKVDAENINQYGKGMLADEVVFDDGWVKARMRITSKEAVEAVLRGDAVELSAGYDVDLDETPGVDPVGRPYDAIQRNIRINHVAIVPKARAGRKARVHLDAGDAITVHKTQEVSMAKITIDGVEFEASENLAMAVSAKLRDDAKELDATKTKLDSATAELDKLKSSRADADAAQARIDALQSELDKTKAELKTAQESKADAEAIEARVKERVALITKVQPLLKADAGFDFSQYSDRQIKEAVLKSDNADLDFTGKSDEYVAARFDAYLEFQAKAPAAKPAAETKTDSLAAALGATKKQGGMGKPSDAQDGYMKMQADAWKKPLTASKGGK